MELSLLDRVNAGWSRLDQEIEAWQREYRAARGSLYCRTGCGNCCTLFVRTTLAEALPAAAILNAAQEEALFSYVERQLAAVRGLSAVKDILRQHRQNIGPCPFLDDSGSCSIYAVRPGSCRALLSTRPAEWCGVDFAALDPYDREAYLSSLDREVVAFPVHYVAATQALALANEASLLDEMKTRLGVTITGNFPLLVYLERIHRLSAVVSAGGDALAAFINRYSAFHPLLFQVE